MSGAEARLVVDRSRCVLCGGPNDCALARREAAVASDARSRNAPEQTCWCVGRVFPESLTRRATQRDGGARCVCLACLEKEIDGDPSGVGL